jgi:hypothetical protein
VATPLSSRVPRAEAIALARPIVERVVWCGVSTVGADGAPRTRLMHPVWRWDGGRPTALVSARPTPLKVAHLRHRPFVSCLYWDPAHDTVAIDATASWVPPDELAAAWAEVATIPAPVGFDPGAIWPGGPTSPDCAFLRLRAHRIVVAPVGRPRAMWNQEPAPAVLTLRGGPR